MLSATPQPNNTTDYPSLDILPHHAALLAASAISPEVATARGYRSITDNSALAHLAFRKYQWVVPGLLVPLHGVDGQQWGFQYRADRARISEDGKGVKYDTPQGQANRLDVPPQCQSDLADPRVRLWITEGARKADAIASKGGCAINVGGVWNWKQRNVYGGITVSVDMDYIAWTGKHGPRDVFLAFDSDVVTKTEVKAALRRLAEIIRRRGASVNVVYFPPGVGDG